MTTSPRLAPPGRRRADLDRRRQSAEAGDSLSVQPGHHDPPAGRPRQGRPGVREVRGPEAHRTAQGDHHPLPGDRC